MRSTVLPFLAPLAIVTLFACGSSMTAGGTTTGTSGSSTAGTSTGTGGSSTSAGTGGSSTSTSAGTGGSSTSTSAGIGGSSTSTSAGTGGSSTGTGGSSTSAGTGGSGGSVAGTGGSSTSAGAGGAGGAADAGADAQPVCEGDLSNIGSGDFRISFTITTTMDNTHFAVLNQRDVCSAGYFWDIRVKYGVVGIETDALTAAEPDDAFVGSCTSINDGQAHQVIVQRLSGILSVYIDGVLEGAGPSTATFGALPALAVGTDVCVGVDDTKAFDNAKGSITNVCVSTVAVSQGDGGVVSCRN